VKKTGGSSKTVDINVGHMAPPGEVGIHKVSEEPEQNNGKLWGHSKFEWATGNALPEYDISNSIKCSLLLCIPCSAKGKVLLHGFSHILSGLIWFQLGELLGVKGM
jgi:hypothetical protein